MKEIWDNYQQKFVTIQEGGAGSGRYPAGSSGQSEGGEQKEPMSAKSLNIDTFKSGVSAPYVNAGISTLGGEDRASLMFTVSIDPKETWKNGYLENSRYIKGSIQHNGRVSVHSGSLGKDIPSMRAKTAKSFEDAVAYVNSYVGKYK